LIKTICHPVTDNISFLSRGSCWVARLDMINLNYVRDTVRPTQ